MSVPDEPLGDGRHGGDRSGPDRPDPDQKERLRRAKLSALARDVLDLRGEPVGVGPITALEADGTVAVLVESGTAAALAGAVIWARRRQAERLVLFADSGAPLLARLASYFTLGSAGVVVHAVSGAGVADVVAEPLPAPVPPPSASASAHLTDELRSAGVDVVVEHGVVRGEVLGLEVARLVEWPTDVGGDGELHLEVGVGRFDRDATAAARPDESPSESLRRAVGMVRERRHVGAHVHPIQLLARERWLRSTVLRNPSLVGASELDAVQMTIEAAGLKDPHPAAALGTDADGQPVVVVCSTGVDLSLVPLAADARQLHAPGGRLVVAVPERDQHPATRSLLELLREPGELLGVAPEWA